MEGSIEVIERLCEIVAHLSEIVKVQASLIEQADIPNEVKEDMKNRRDIADLELESAGRKARRLQGEQHG